MQSPEIFAPQWFVIQTRFQKEKTANENLLNQAIPTLYPRKEVPDSRNRATPRPYFPRYLFARFPIMQLSKVRHTRGVSRVVEFEPGQPLSVEDWIVEEIAAHMNENGVMLDQKLNAAGVFQPNEPVIITGGPFINRTGLYLRERKDVITVGLDAVGCTVDLARHWVSKICFN